MRRRRSNARNRRTVVRSETVVSTEEVSEALDTKSEETFDHLADVAAAAEGVDSQESEAVLQ